MKLSTAVLNILDASALDGQALRLPEQLDRKTYVQVAKAIEAAGGKWDRKAGAHLFEVPAADAIDQIIATGGVTTRQELQQFFTPPALAERVVACADIQQGNKVLEPSAGKGALALPACRQGAEVTCVEIGECARVLEGRFGSRLFGTDFLILTPADLGLFDRVCMNPPFQRQADIRHVSHALQFLRPGGRLVAVMSAGTLFRDNRLTTDFRATIAALGGTFEELPPGSFKESGTMVNICLLTVGG